MKNFNHFLLRARANQGVRTDIRQKSDESAPIRTDEAVSELANISRDPSPAPSLALPATMIDRTVGLCLCWLCMPRPMTRQDQDWMFDVLAKHALAMPEVDRRIWVQDWTLRHGDFAGAVLKRHMDKFTAIEKG